MPGRHGRHGRHDVDGAMPGARRPRPSPCQHGFGPASLDRSAPDGLASARAPLRRGPFAFAVRSAAMTPRPRRSVHVSEAADRRQPAAHTALHLSASDRAGGRTGLRQAREPPAGRRVQGRRRGQPRRAARRRTISSEDCSRRRAATTASSSRSARGDVGVTARICMPERRRIACKVDAMESARRGARSWHGETSTSRARTPRRLAREHDYRYVHSGDEPRLIAGVGERRRVEIDLEQ